MSVAVFEERFLKLVDENGGFEFCQAYRNDADHVLGGKGDSCWYVILKKGKVAESYIGKYRGGAWEDTRVKGSGAARKTKAMPAGSTLRKIAEKAYWMQSEPWDTRRTPQPVEDAHPRFHYVYGIGEKGLDVSVRYGVTVAYNDLGDPDAGFRLRYLYTGADVETP